MRICWSVLAFVALLVSQWSSQATAGLFKMDFGTLQNTEDGIWIDPDGEDVEFPGELEDWDEFATFNLFDCGECDFTEIDGLDAWVWKLTDWSADGDDDVTLTIFDHEELADQAGGAFANGMIHNNPVPQFLDVVYDGIEVPMQVKDDYLYRDPDTANTEILFRFGNLNPGDYNVTLFTGRPSDLNGQYAKVWVESDALGKGEPDEENTGNFTGFDPDVGLEEPEGIPVTIPVTIGEDEFLWYAHMEDNSGGISGIIIRQTDSAGLRGDFNANGSLDAEDMDLLSNEVRAETNNVEFDLNGDSLVNNNDRDVWVNAPDIGNTYYGDSNLDGEFNSSDLVTVFAAGKYEVDVEAGWADGDWDGDARYNSSDLVVAFSNGGYELGPREAMNAVPEPASFFMVCTGLIAIAIRRRCVT